MVVVDARIQYGNRNRRGICSRFPCFRGIDLFQSPLTGIIRVIRHGIGLINMIWPDKTA